MGVLCNQPLHGSQTCGGKCALEFNEAMSHAMQGNPRQVIVKISDEMRSTGRGNGKPLQYFLLLEHMNCRKRQKDRTPEDELSRSGGVQYVTVEEQKGITNRFRKKETAGSKQK